LTLVVGWELATTRPGSFTALTPVESTFILRGLDRQVKAHCEKALVVQQNGLLSLDRRADLGILTRVEALALGIADWIEPATGLSSMST